MTYSQHICGLVATQEDLHEGHGNVALVVSSREGRKAVGFATPTGVCNRIATIGHRSDREREVQDGEHKCRRYASRRASRY